MSGHERRAEAAARVRATYPPLPEIFAALRAALGATLPPPEDVPDLPDGVVETLVKAAHEASGDVDDVAFGLALAVVGPVVEAVQEGARAARNAGVPGDGDVPTSAAVDAVLALLGPYAAQVARDPANPPRPPDGLSDRIQGIARSAGVVGAVAGTSWSVVQHFGDPYCPRTACYGHNGAALTAERIAADGFPPYGDGCNCTAVPVDLPAAHRSD